MGKNNYFAVHKNKKLKRKLEKVNWKPIYAVISKANELVKNLVELRNSSIRLSKSIPKYKMGRNNQIAIVGNNDSSEMIVNLKGHNHILKRNESISFGGVTAEELTEASKIFSESFPSIKDFNSNFGRDPKHIGKYKEITEDILKKPNITITLGFTDKEDFEKNSHYISPEQVANYLK